VGLWIKVPPRGDAIHEEEEWKGGVRGGVVRGKT